MTRVSTWLAMKPGVNDCLWRQMQFRWMVYENRKWNSVMAWSGISGDNLASPICGGAIMPMLSWLKDFLYCSCHAHCMSCFWSRKMLRG